MNWFRYLYASISRRARRVFYDFMAIRYGALGLIEWTMVAIADDTYFRKSILMVVKKRSRGRSRSN